MVSGGLSVALPAAAVVGSPAVPVVARVPVSALPATDASREAASGGVVVLPRVVGGAVGSAVAGAVGELTAAVPVVGVLPVEGVVAGGGVTVEAVLLVLVVPVSLGELVLGGLTVLSGVA